MAEKFGWIKQLGDPLVNIAGAYFPAWLACGLAAIAGTWLLWAVAPRLRCAPLLHPAPLMLPAAFVLIACGLWLLLFSAG